MLISKKSAPSKYNDAAMKTALSVVSESGYGEYSGVENELQ